jgi:hypothetical protein
MITHEIFCSERNIVWRQQQGWNWQESPVHARFLSSMDTCTERELLKNCLDPMDGSFCHFHRILLSLSKPKVSAAAAFHRNKKHHDPPCLLEQPLQLTHHGEQVRQPKHCQFHQRNGLQSKPSRENDATQPSLKFFLMANSIREVTILHPQPLQIQRNPPLPHRQDGMPC